jgi:hypothetical protein
MARKQEGHEVNRGKNGGSTQSHGSSDLQLRKRENTRSGSGDTMNRRHDASRSPSRSDESVSQQSNADTDGGAPSRQTSTAGEEKGQL